VRDGPGGDAVTEADVAIDRMFGRASKALVILEQAWRHYSRAPGGSSLEKLARTWAACDRLRLALVGSRDEMGLLALLVEEIGPLLPRTESGGAEAVVDGVGRLVRHGHKKQERWKPDQLIPEVASVLAARIADDPWTIYDRATGETAPPSEIARRATAAAVLFMADLCGMTPSRAWKATALQGLGIDPADYRSRSYEGWSLEVERGVVDGAPEDDNGDREDN